MTDAVRIRGVVLPEEREVELWIRDGLFHFEGPREASELAAPGAFLLSGLVDNHSHVSWPHDRESPAHTPEFMDASRQVYASTGVTLLRDMGSHADAVISLPPVPGLPRVRAAGTLLLRHESWPFTPTAPENLRATALSQVSRGAPWVKVFSDWSSDYSGRENTAFSGDDELTYPLEVLRDTVEAVHAAGARLAAHCFTYAGAEVAIEAGVDSLEHGWGVDEALVRIMAERRMGWVPMLGIAVPMVETAARFEEQHRVRWMEERMDALHHLLPLAQRLGTCLLAGTDWHPEVTVAHEVSMLHEFGVPREAALAAGSWAARSYLGETGIEAGAPADLLVLRDDPRRNLESLLHPEAIVIGGTRVTADLSLLQRKRRGWRDVRPGRGAAQTP